MLEIEQKYRVADSSALEAVLTRLDATAASSRAESDHYFAAPDRDLAETDEVVRLRSCGLDNTLTYKGPKSVGAIKTRPEVELAVQSGPDGVRAAVTWLMAIRYQPVAIVEKNRQPFTLHRNGFEVHVCLDNVGAIGNFVELEILALETDRAQAESTILATAGELGLTEPESRSYLSMVLAQPLSSNLRLT